MLSSKSYYAQQKWSEQMDEVRLSHQFLKSLWNSAVADHRAVAIASRITGLH